MVRDEPHRVDFFSGRAGRDDNALSGEVLFAGDFAQEPVEQHLFRGHLAAARVAARQIARIRLDDRVAEPAELFQIVLHNRVFKHIRVHRRGKQNRAPAGAGHDGRRQHIVRDAVRDLADHVRARRRDKHDIRALCERDMLDAVLEIPVEGVDQALVARQCLKGRRVDEIRCILRHQHRDVRMLLDEHARKPCDLVGRYAARHAEQNGFSLQHVVFSFPRGVKTRIGKLSRITSRACCTSRSAPPAIICTAMLPIAVPSVGPA